MKTLVLSLLISSATISVHGQPVCVTENIPVATFSETTAALQAGIFSKIQQYMRVPESMKNVVSSERVRVVFTIDENGKAHVVDVCTRRPELKGSVTSQFEAIDFSDSRDTNGQEFSIWLNFKVM